MSRWAASLLAMVVVMASCTSDDDGAGTTTAPGALTTTTSEQPPGAVTLITHDSFAVSEDVLASFTATTGIEVEILRAGDAGTMLNQAILTKDNPLADVVFGIDNTFATRALTAGILEPYAARDLASVPNALHADDSQRLTPIDFGDVCINYDRATIPDEDAPADLAQLTEDRYRGRLVVENPATSSPGLAFLLATIARFPEDASYSWQDFWSDLRANDVLVVGGWEEAYYTEFSGGSGSGERPLVVSYASSPPAEVIFTVPPPDRAPTGVVAGGCFRQVEYAGILTGTRVPEEARRLVDFMLSLSFQEDIPLQMFVFPANQDAALPPEFVAHTVIPDEPLVLDPFDIDANRIRWIDEWTDIVLR